MPTAWTPVQVPGQGVPAKKVSAPPKPRAGWNTLRLLKSGRLVIVVLDLLLVMAVVTATETHRAALKTVGRDAAPSIVAAQHIKSAMADMDADAANELLAAPGTASASAAGFQERRVEAVKALIGAAENITYGDAERGPLQTLEVELGSYEDLVQRARDFHANGDPKTVEAYRAAGTLMDGTLLPAADALDKANNDVLERTYETQSFRSSGSRLTIFVIGALLLLTLAVMQITLSQRMHRTFNPLLLAATLVVIVVAAHAVSAVSGSHNDLKVAKDDAFTSIHALWRARATAYQANGEESRSLLDAAHAAEHEAAFQGEANALFASSGRLTDAELLDALRVRTELAGLSGYLGDELQNVTFSGERDAALDTLAGWQRYLVIDRNLRKLEHAGQRKAAVELCTGAAPGQSDWAFAQFDAALDRTLAINQRAFDEAVSHGIGALGNLEPLAGGCGVLVAVLVFFGLAPRIREYQ